MPDPTEIATLIVNGQRYEDWETVYVRLALKDNPPFTFRFTAVEDAAEQNIFNLLRIRPGFTCTVLLAGHIAITGRVQTRQVYFDSNRHAVEIQGATTMQSATVASAVTKTGEFKNQTPLQIIKALAGIVGQNVTVEGGSLPNIKLPKLSLSGTGTVYQEIGRILKTFGGSITSNNEGQLVIAMGPVDHTDTIYEGDLGRPTILEGREVINNKHLHSSAPALGQKPPGSEDEYGAKLASMPFFREFMKQLNLDPQKLPKVIMSEIPGWTQEHLQGRAEVEKNWLITDSLTIIATMQGWLRPDSQLWRVNQKVKVISPMLLMKEGMEALTMKSVTFTQDNQGGTRAQLELCNTIALGPGVPQMSEGGAQQGAGLTGPAGGTAPT